ncbi:MAG: MarR family transcriptional regulator [Methylacidiphilales bacterium]|nr:MarR family transcriptional regulator [Candidatus Methylacidiphilales bacterium]MDW8350046.1 MarR family transcriptional regulator [Verrucomicrobiae bacterium]
MTSSNTSQEIETLIPLIMRLQRIFLIDLNRRTNQGNISISQFTLLSILNQFGPQKMSTLSHYMHHTSSATTGLVDRLIKLGLVKRHHDEKDRRQIWIKLTSKGEKMVDDMRKDLYAKITRISERLGKKDTQAWVRIYQTILHELEHAAPSPHAA